MDYRNRITLITIIILSLLCCRKIAEHNNDSLQFPLNSMEAAELFNQQIPLPVVINRPENIFPVSGTVSHHLLTASIINEWFKTLQELRKIKTFFILCPNHTRLGNELISLSSQAWQFNNQTILTHKSYIAKIIKALNLHEDSAALQYEHGIYTLLPFIKHYFPDARIVPIVLNEDHKQIGLTMNLAYTLADIMQKDRNTFLLISIDFSHRAERKLTNQRDAVSREVLSSLTTSRINTIYSDNNVSLFVLFDCCRRLHMSQTHFFCHTDAEELTGLKLGNDITSYFFTFQY